MVKVLMLTLPSIEICALVQYTLKKKQKKSEFIPIILEASLCLYIA